MAGRILRHFRSHAVAYLVLGLVATSGTAYALGKNSIGSRELAKNSVGASELKSNSVAAENLRANSVGASELDDGFCGYVGQMLLLPWTNFTPEGTLAANGQPLPIENYKALFALIGDQFGGDAERNTFSLPKLDPPLAGTQYVVCVDGVFPSRP